MKTHEILGIKKSQIITPYAILDETYNQIPKNIILPSGSKNFDYILGGGFSLRKNYLIFGSNKTGKTQLCHQLCVQAYKYFKKFKIENPGGSIFYFDTENTFRPGRIKELSNSSDNDDNGVLKTIYVSKIMSNSAFIFALNGFEDMILKNRVSILLIDSINNHFNADLGNKKIPFNKTRKVFLEILTKINNLSRKYNIIVIVTAQVATNFSKNHIIREIPVGNQFLNHFFSEYVYLSKVSRDNNIAQLVNSSTFQEKRFSYKITSSGIQDY